MAYSAHTKGFMGLGVAVAIAILAVLSVVMFNLVASNQSTRNQQLYIDQSFYSAIAGIEYSRGAIASNTTINPIPPRSLLREQITTLRSGTPTNKIQVLGRKGIAVASFSITDPNPLTQGSYLFIDVSHPVNHAHKNLQGITISRSGGSQTLSIVSMTISWTGYPTSNLSRIVIGGVQVFSGSAGSGALYPFSSTVTLTSSTPIAIDFQWDNMPQSVPIILQFNMGDGSRNSASVTV